MTKNESNINKCLDLDKRKMHGGQYDIPLPHGGMGTQITGTN